MSVAHVVGTGLSWSVRKLDIKSLRSVDLRYSVSVPFAGGATTRGRYALRKRLASHVICVTYRVYSYRQGA